MYLTPKNHPFHVGYMRNIIFIFQLLTLEKQNKQRSVFSSIYSQSITLIYKKFIVLLTKDVKHLNFELETNRND